MKCGTAAVALLAFAFGQPAASQRRATAEQQTYGRFMPPLESIAQPVEQPVLEAFIASAHAPDHDAAQVLAAADEALGKLPSPTRLRGYVQLVRSHALENLHRDSDAVAAAEESVELLPGYSAPLIRAFTLNAYLNRTVQAADYLMRAITVDPAGAANIDDYEIDNLLRRLRGFHQEAQARAISDKLLQIGWIGRRLDSRSELALGAIKLHLNDHDVAGAKALVPKLLDPGDSRGLLTLNAAAEIWPDIEAWAGPRLERQWPIYLSEARARWEAGKTTTAARDYLMALKTAGEDETAVRNFLPLFDNPNPQDIDLIFMVPPLANTLAHLGRWADADALYERAQQAWPIDWQANALNISANHALLLLEEGHADKALELMDQSLAQARRWGPQVGQTALVRMEHSRACMLHALGRDAEARLSMVQALAVERGPGAAALDLCMGDPAAAKRALLDALGNEATRDDVIGFMQPGDAAPDPSPYAQKQRAAADALRADAEIRAAVAEYGRILPWRLNEAVHVDVQQSSR